MKLKSLFISNPLTNEKRPTSAGNALIPSAWIRAWRMWINSPRLFFRPSWPDNGIFVCSHGLLRFDPSKPQDLADHELCLVKGDDWEEIVRLWVLQPDRLRIVTPQVDIQGLGHVLV